MSPIKSFALAVGSVDGDVLLLRPEPAQDPIDEPLALRLLRHSNTLPVSMQAQVKGALSAPASTIVSICWALNGRRWLTLNQAGTLVLWGFTAAESHLTCPADLDVQRAPVPLRVLPIGDLCPQQGPFALSATAQQGRLPRPTAISFFPALTILGDQPAIVVGFDNGDIMKIDCEPGWPAKPCLKHRSTMSLAAGGSGATQSCVGQQLPFELFRGMWRFWGSTAAEVEWDGKSRALTSWLNCCVLLASAEFRAQPWYSSDWLCAAYAADGDGGRPFSHHAVDLQQRPVCRLWMASLGPAEPAGRYFSWATVAFLHFWSLTVK